MIRDFSYISVANTEEAVKHIGKSYIAGGTDLVPLLKYEVRDFEEIVDISKLLELKYRKGDENSVLIGATETLTNIENCEGINKHFPALAFSAKCVASPQIRNVATIGGNIMQDRRCIYFNQSYEWRVSIAKCFKTGGEVCHQAPKSPTCRALYYSDVATALYAYNASVKVADKDGERIIQLNELLERHGEINGTTESDNLFVKEFIISKNTLWSKFIKLSVRDSIDFPTFNAAVNIYSENGQKKINIACGAVNMHPIMLKETSQLLNDNAGNIDAVLEEAKELAVKEIQKNTMGLREEVITPKVKKNSYNAIVELIEEAVKEL